MKFSYGIVRGLGKEQGRTLSMPWKWFSSRCPATSCEKILDFVFRKQRFDLGSLRRQPHSLESHTWAKFGWRPGRPLQVTEGWAQLTSNSSHCQAHTLWRSVLSSYSFSKMPAFLLPGGSCLLWGSGVPLFPAAPCCAGGLCSRDPAGSPSAPSPLWKLPRFTPDWRFKGDHLAFPGDIFHCPAWG